MSADRADRLVGCERKTLLSSPLPSTSPYRGRRTTTFLVRFRTIEEVATNGEFFSIKVAGPSGCGKIETNSLGVRYRRDAVVRYRLRAVLGRREEREALVPRRLPRAASASSRSSTGGCGPVPALPPPAARWAIRVGSFSFRVR